MTTAKAGSVILIHYSQDSRRLLEARLRRLGLSIHLVDGRAPDALLSVRTLPDKAVVVIDRSAQDISLSQAVRQVSQVLPQSLVLTASPQGGRVDVYWNGQRVRQEESLEEALGDYRILAGALPPSGGEMAETMADGAITGALQGEHRWIDQRLERSHQGITSGHADPGPFKEAATALRRHIYLEEEVLFPLLEARGLADPLWVMVQEHGEIWRLLDRTQELIESGAGQGRIANTFKALLSLLEEHNFKEEQVLYPMADVLVGEDEVADVLERLKSAGPPSGWVCQALRDQNPDEP